MWDTKKYDCLSHRKVEVKEVIFDYDQLKSMGNLIIWEALY